MQAPASASASASASSRLNDLDLSGDDTETDEPLIDSLKRGPDNEEPADALLKKKVKRVKPFTEEILVSRNGLVRIYEDFPRGELFRGRGFELQDMKRVLKMYKEWGYQLHPGLAFPDLMAKCVTFGSKARTKKCLVDLRGRERDKYVVS